MVTCGSRTLHAAAADEKRHQEHAAAAAAAVYKVEVGGGKRVCAFLWLVLCE